jgi:hypothetical protein
MSGEKANISQFCKLSFYEWIMYREESKLVAFSNENPTLGQYLGIAINVGMEMTAKILKANSQVAYRSTYQGLT